MVFEPAVMKETDRLRIIARESEAHWGYDKAFMDTFDRTFNITGEFIARYPIFCVREHGEITAFWGGMPEENVFHLEYFYIGRQVIKRGYGRRMWEHMTAWCRGEEMERVIFVTSWQAVGFYEKMGALQDGVSRSLIDGRDIPRFIYCIKQGTCLDLKSCP